MDRQNPDSDRVDQKIIFQTACGHVPGSRLWFYDQAVATVFWFFQTAATKIEHFQTTAIEIQFIQTLRTDAVCPRPAQLKES